MCIELDRSSIVLYRIYAKYEKRMGVLCYGYNQFGLFWDYRQYYLIGAQEAKSSTKQRRNVLSRELRGVCIPTERYIYIYRYIK